MSSHMLATADQRKELLKNGLSVLHESLADWILINPGGTYREMGAYFNYSISWLCQVVTSDMFRAYMAKRREGIVASVQESLPKKLEAAAHLAVERVIEVMEKSEDADTLLDGFDKIMHRYGYAPNAKNGAQAQAGFIQQNNVFFLTREELQDAKRQLVLTHQAPPTPIEEKVVGELMAPTEQ